MNENYNADIVKQLINKAGAIVYKSPDKCIEYAKQALEISQKLKFPMGIGMSLMDIGLGNYYKGNYVTVIAYYSKALNIFKKNDFLPAISQLLNNYGTLYVKLLDYEKALECYLEAIEIDSNIGNKKNISLTYNNIGNIYRDTNSTAKALINYKKALSIAEEANYPYAIALVLRNIGTIYMENLDYKTALDYIKKSVDICLKTDKIQVLIENYTLLADIYKIRKEYDKSMKFLKNSLNYIKEMRNKKYELSILTKIASLYIINKDYRQAGELLIRLEKEAVEENSKEHLNTIYSQLSLLYEKTGKLQKALECMKKQHEIESEIYNKKNTDKMAILQIKFEVRTKEKELELEHAKAENFRQINIKLKEKNKQIEKQKIELEKALEKLRKSEIKYHFVAKELNRKIGATLVGESSGIKAIIDLIKTVALSEKTNVLITGESGTGKEIVSRIIHKMSKRKDNSFYAVNSSAIPDSLFESEFFGYEKDAFTGASKTHIGWFEIANHGTLFLDEIGTMSINQQVKLLRVLEERKIVRLGSHHEINLNLRVISASNQDLLKKIREGTFRNDLYHRLATFVINIPPLRERKEDIPLLVRHFVRIFSKLLNKTIKRIDDEVYTKLLQYDFPGNVRELKNIVERAILITDSSTLRVKDFIIPKADFSNESFDDIIPLEVMEKKLVLKALKATDFNRSKAAKILKVNRKVIERRIKKYNLLND